MQTSLVHRIFILIITVISLQGHAHYILRLTDRDGGQLLCGVIKIICPTHYYKNLMGGREKIIFNV